jgi:hypothetical protein
MWHDASGGDPFWEMPSFSNQFCDKPRAMHRTVATHPQEVLENTVDFAHFRFIHQTHMMRAVSGPRIDGPVFEVTIECDPEAVQPELRLPVGDFSPEGSTFDHGPGLAGATISGKGLPIRALQRLYATPIDGHSVALLGVVNVAMEQGSSDDAVDAIAEQLAAAVFENWDLDIPIWESKRYQPRPALNATERLIPTFRRWYSQFYRPTTGTKSVRPSAREQASPLP